MLAEAGPGVFRRIGIGRFQVRFAGSNIERATWLAEMKLGTSEWKTISLV